MEQQTPEIQTPETTVSTEQVAQQNTVQSVDTSTKDSSFAEGGITGKSFDLTFWVISPLLIVASLYSIYYHKQALNKLYDNSSEKKMQSQIDELKSNLKSLMGAKYKML